MAKAREMTGLNCEASAMMSIRLVLQTRPKEMCELRASAEGEDKARAFLMRVCFL